MTINISNAAYLANSIKNRPLVFWHYTIGPGGFASTDAEPGFPASNLWSADTFTFWQSTDVSNTTIKNVVFESEGDAPINYVMFTGTNFSNFSFGTRDGEVFISKSPNGTDWTFISGTDTEFIGDGTVIVYFDEETGPFFRVQLVPSSATSSEFMTVSHLRAGTATVLARPMYVGQSPSDRTVSRISNRSDSGKYLGDTVISDVRSYSISQDNTKPQFVRDFVVPFLKHARCIGTMGFGPCGSFGFAWRPEDYPDEVLYCHPPDSLDWPNNSKRNGNMAWSINGAAEE